MYEFCSITENCLCRRVRAGACPVLTIQAFYPQLVASDPSDAKGINVEKQGIARFNDCYSQAAKAFVEGGTVALGGALIAEYEALSEIAKYRFRRRLLVCRMIPSFLACVPYEKKRSGFLRVEIFRLEGSSRIDDQAGQPIGVHLWRLPLATLEGDGAFSKKNYQKLLKNQG